MKAGEITIKVRAGDDWKLRAALVVADYAVERVCSGRTTMDTMAVGGTVYRVFYNPSENLLIVEEEGVS